MASILKYILAGALLQLMSCCAFAQMGTNGNGQKQLKLPKNRELFHDNIDKEQKALLAIDGKADNELVVSNNEEVNLLLTRTVTLVVDDFQYSVESDSLLDHRLKVNYLTGMANLLKYSKQNWRSKKVNPLHLPQIIEAYKECSRRDHAGESIYPVLVPLPYDVGMAVIASGIFSKNTGYQSIKDELVLKYCKLHPSETFITLKDNPNVPFADSLIKAVARKYPGQLYTYAQAGNKLGAIIRGINNDDFVMAVVRMSKSKSGQQYFPFLDNIVKGKLSFEQIDQANNDSVQYYRLLVNTQIEYVQRAVNGDTALAFKDLTTKLEKNARDIFVTTINGLHELPDAARFRCIQSLTAEELYYLAVLSDGLIYTSSYTNGVYPLMMKKINNRGDSLLLNLKFDHYRKFISQAAAYNKLGNFLGSFSNQEDAHNLMQAFVNNLEKSQGLEDGVDVADSYASIIESLKPMADEMLVNIKTNYQRNLKANNKRGIVIYNILYKLFLSADSTNNINLTKELGIPPVYQVPASSLVNEKGEAIVQMFFYGDKDGKTDFSIFQGMFNNANWKIDKSNKQWVVVKSAKGNPVSIYANTPFDEETGEDDKAQQALGDYFEKNNIHPAVTVNRGHSYHAETTIAYMDPGSRIVFMGSCGGFHLIDAILKKSPDAHIIASKQIGKRDINKPFLLLLTEKLRTGSNIDWIPFWKEFHKNANVQGFEDYIPPYKNLGAIFIKAYKQAMGDEVED